ncbi:hypothetical protein [Brevibacterium luteolum]|uniref:hypothetical protein n=1 Tax=Brevibacterium luteolum TaxID=199591 RepID=UPI00223BBE30|nr:hypothetical protein [Brevibacterium luteolum]MCT1656505.1 hypothetical protein [Brevibacterium luteolum]MCT1874195.1 hypothetical protein [Brevibacterium luteolum]MCT1891493.1 hypothetical protein [Brevibacterium luteolum]MCT1893929.1 hypothetical protein [Brevibacterium luteolum]
MRTAREVLAWLKFLQPGVTKTQADLLLVCAQAWWLAWHEEPLFEDETAIGEYGPFVAAAHDGFPQAMPRRPELDLREQLEFEAIISHYMRLPTTRLVDLGRLAVDGRTSGTLTLDELREIAMREADAWAAAGAEATAQVPQRPTSDDLESAEQRIRAKELRRQMALREPTFGGGASPGGTAALREPVLRDPLVGEH